MMEKLLEGFFDLHVHAGPSIIPREIDAAEMAALASKFLYRGIVLKDHHYCTAPLATVIKKHLPINSETQVLGSIVLNNSVGGVNAAAVDAAISLGARIVWMPTVSSRNHITKTQGHNVKFPSGKKLTVPEKPLCLLDDRGRLIPEAESVLETVAAHDHVALCPGHGGRDEVNAIIERAHSLGIKRLFVSHPAYIIGASLDDMKYWASLGAYIEHTAVLSVPSSHLYSVNVSEIVTAIRAVGAAGTIISSDYGQSGNGCPAQGISQFFELLLQNGITQDEIIEMSQANPCRLLGL